MEKINKLPDCEEKIMVIIWNSIGAITSAQLMIQTNEKYGKDWKYQTVCTFLCRLRKKGYLEAVKEGSHLKYLPRITVQEYRKVILTELIDLLYKGSAAELLQELTLRE